MLSLCMAVLCSSLVSIVMRLSGSRVTHNLGMLTMNYIVCSLLAAVFCDYDQVLPMSQLSQTVAFGMVNGILYLAGFVLMQMNIRKNGVVLSSIFQKLGLLVTLVVSVVFYREIPDLLQGSGFVLAIFAIVLMNYQKDSTGAGSKGALLVMLLACGMADAMSKIFTESGPAGQEPQFLFFTFATAMVLCWGLMASKRQRIGWKEAAFGALIAHATNPDTIDYQPMHVNFGVLPPLDPPIRNKRDRYAAYAARGERALSEYRAALEHAGLIGGM